MRQRTRTFERLLTQAFLVFLVWLLPLSGWAGVGYLPQALIEGTQVQRWNDSNQTIAVTIKSGSSISGWSPDMIGLVKSAFAEWEQALGGRVHFEYTADPSKTDIMVTWATRSYGTQVGHQQIQYEDNVLTNADITIAMLSPNGQRLSRPELRSVALHEIGHALGIRGHSETAGDIMYPSLQPGVIHLSASDIATIRGLYRLKPDITNPKGVHLMAYRQFSYYTRLGYDAFKRQDYQSAYTYFKKAKFYYPHAMKISYFIGISALNLKKIDEAVAYLEKAAICPCDMQGDSMFLLGSALAMKTAESLKTGNRTEARTQLERSKQLYKAVVASPNTKPDLKRRAKEQLDKLVSIKI